MNELARGDCEECGAPAEYDGPEFTMTGTAIVVMRRVLCAAGHRYMVVLEAVDL